MEQILVAFITGLTTGGLSCLAVQGGLLASSLERQIEQDILSRPARPAGKKQRRAPRQPAHPLTLPILLFLGAKLAAYTALGFLLGALGSVFQLNAITQAILLMVIGIFMVGNALRMFNVHRIFRYFVIEPPKFITRYIRRSAKNGTAYFTSLFLGALTVLIPCGVTQAMMAIAIGTGDPLQGAAIMFAFVLGTSPVFFFVAYLAMQIGARMEALFMRFVAIVVLILGLITIDSGLNLIGSPFSFTNMARAAFPSAQVGEALPASSTLTLNAGNGGYSPRRLYAVAGEPVLLNVVTQKTYSCSRDFVIPALGVQILLPETGTVPIDIPPQPAGRVMRFTCSMGMYTGVIVFSQ